MKIINILPFEYEVAWHLTFFAISEQFKLVIAVHVCAGAGTTFETKVLYNRLIIIFKSLHLYTLKQLTSSVSSVSGVSAKSTSDSESFEDSEPLEDSKSDSNPSVVTRVSRLVYIRNNMSVDISWLNTWIS